MLMVHGSKCKWTPILWSSLVMLPWNAMGATERSLSASSAIHFDKDKRFAFNTLSTLVLNTAEATGADEGTVCYRSQTFPRVVVYPTRPLCTVVGLLSDEAMPSLSNSRSGMS